MFLDRQISILEWFLKDTEYWSNDAENLKQMLNSAT